jgi:hypothetical protein
MPVTQQLDERQRAYSLLEMVVLRVDATPLLVLAPEVGRQLRDSFSVEASQRVFTIVERMFPRVS